MCILHIKMYIKCGSPYSKAYVKSNFNITFCRSFRIKSLDGVKQPGKQFYNRNVESQVSLSPYTLLYSDRVVHPSGIMDKTFTSIPLCEFGCRFIK